MQITHVDPAKPTLIGQVSSEKLSEVLISRIEKIEKKHIGYLTKNKEIPMLDMTVKGIVKHTTQMTLKDDSVR